MRIYIVRHAESTGNFPKEQRTGGIDPPLTERGRMQAELLGRRLEGASFDAVITSPLTRTLQTTAAIAARIGNPIVYLWNELVECGTGDFPGLSLEEAGKIYPNVAPLFEGAVGVPVGQENERMYAMRAHRVASYLERNYPKDATILLICHFSFLRHVLNALLNLPADPIMHYGQNNGALSLISVEEEDGKVKRRIHYLNDLAHLYGTEYLTHREY